MSVGIVTLCSVLGLLLSFLPSSVKGLENMDTLHPIVKISPAKAAQMTDDRFGFSVTIHRLQKIGANDTLEEAFQKFTLVVGAPFGQFPGGISGLNYSSRACAANLSATITDDTVLQMMLSDTTQEERAECHDFRTGLVYQCPLSESNCDAIVGNGDATSPDGDLFDRAGNDIDVVSAIESNSRAGSEMREDQQMGFTVKSYEGFLIACAPHYKLLNKNNNAPQPRGKCVYSGPSLSDFIRAIPCEKGTGLNQNNEGYCTAGITVELKDGVESTVDFLLGLPGRIYSRGGVAYYANASSTVGVEFDLRDPTVRPSIGQDDAVLQRNYLNVPVADGSVGYYGLAMSSGKILSTGEATQFVVAAPRNDKDYFLFGYVYVLNSSNYEVVPPIQVKGIQYAELFGFSVAALDLNNDGFDDLVVGAPIYSEPGSPELGRLFVFENNQSNGFSDPTILFGHVPNSRFGSSLSAMGDLNNDGFEDFAVGAPFEGAGVVYIYYGQERDSTGSVVNRQYGQRIDGSSFANRVSNITEVSMFGFSLSGSVDVDNNQYNDLAVGIHAAQAVLILRSRPFARVTSSLESVANVRLDSFRCNLNGMIYSCFEVKFCASYYGKSIDNGFETTFMLWEPEPQSNKEPPRRLIFSAEDITSPSIITPITFDEEGNVTCVNRTVYIRNGTTSLFQFRLRAEVLNINRPEVIVDTTSPIVDLSDQPVVSADIANIEVAVFAECGPDEICESDLSLEHVGTTFFTRSGELSEDQVNLVVDNVENVIITAALVNTDEDAFNSLLTFAIPRNYLSFDQISFNNFRVSTCVEIDSDNTTHDVRQCGVITPFSKSDAVNITLRLRVNTLLGNEDDLIVPLWVMVGANSTRNNEPESRLGNNTLSVKLPVQAETALIVSGQFASSSVVYQGNHTPNVMGEASNLGESVPLTVTLRNEGPSNTRNASVSIYIPAQLPDVTGSYYYYPASLTSSSNVKCITDNLNSEGLSVSNNRKRFFRRTRRSSYGELVRMTRQQGVEEQQFSLDCYKSPTDCVQVTCDVYNLRTSVDIVITGYIDERFFNNKEDNYALRAFVSAEIINDYYIVRNGSILNDTFKLNIQARVLSTSRSAIEWYVIVAPIVGAIIFLLILAVALYCFGFFKRKTGDSKEDNADEFDQFDSNPFGNARSGSNTAGVPTSGDPELKKFQEAKHEAL